MNIYEKLRKSLKDAVTEHGLAGKPVRVRCRALSAAEAIGAPRHDDYPIIRGREVMMEAEFEGACGQAFTDEYSAAEYSVDELAALDYTTNRNRAVFVAGLNAVYRHLGLCDDTVHCRNAEPEECAAGLPDAFKTGTKVLLVGLQPRFLETLAGFTPVRAVDLDKDNIGTERFGVLIEPPSRTADALDWCDTVFATGSTLVNGTMASFIEQEKPVVFYGVTVAAAAEILGLARFCPCGH